MHIHPEPILYTYVILKNFKNPKYKYCSFSFLYFHFSNRNHSFSRLPSPSLSLVVAAHSSTVPLPPPCLPPLCHSLLHLGGDGGYSFVLWKRSCCSIDDIGFCSKRKFPIESQLKNDLSHHFCDVFIWWGLVQLRACGESRGGIGWLRFGSLLEWAERRCFAETHYFRSTTLWADGLPRLWWFWFGLNWKNEGFCFLGFQVFCASIFGVF